MVIISLECFIDSSMNAPSAKGMNIKKENFTAFSFSILKNIAVEIVIPLLEIPGNSARACINPITKEFLVEKLEESLGLFENVMNLVEKTIIPVKMKNIPIKK